VPPSLVSGGGRLVLDRGRLPHLLPRADQWRRTRRRQAVGPKTLALMTSNHLPAARDLPAMSRSMFSEATYNGIGFGLGFSVTMTPRRP